ncbi:MAG: hypothetical protein J0H68_02785 [Sphingobacteriia bacterium]|nr:hypothetical protein [Sphingobacteriia bacterium]
MRYHVAINGIIKTNVSVEENKQFESKKVTDGIEGNVNIQDENGEYFILHNEEVNNIDSQLEVFTTRNQILNHINSGISDSKFIYKDEKNKLHLISYKLSSNMNISNVIKIITKIEEIKNIEFLFEELDDFYYNEFLDFDCYV